MNSFETKTLKLALERLLLAVPKKGSLPVLENVRWQLDGAKAVLTTTDLDNRVQVSVPIASGRTPEKTDVLIPAEQLYQGVKRESASAIGIRLHGENMELQAGNRVLVLPRVEPKNFPEVDDSDLAVRGLLLSSAVRDALSKTLFCSSTDSSRYSLNTLRLEAHGSVFRLLATDGHRLSWVEGAAKWRATDGFFALVLRSTAGILNRLLAQIDGGWLEFSTSPPGAEQPLNRFVFPDGTRLIARQGQGQFPNYENVMPKAPIEARIVFGRDELLDGLAKLSPTTAKAEKAVVTLELSGRPIVIRSETNGTATRIELHDALVSGKARPVGFNSQYLLQYVKSLETEKVSMTLFPLTISEVALFDSFRYRHLLMPVRV